MLEVQVVRMTKLLRLFRFFVKHCKITFHDFKSNYLYQNRHGLAVSAVDVQGAGNGLQIFKLLNFKGIFHT